MVRILGLRFALKFLLGWLHPAEVESKAGALIGGTGAAVVVDEPTIGMDVDKPDDVVLAERALYGMTQGRPSA